MDANATVTLQRRQRAGAEPTIPLPVPHAADLVVVDIAWGRLQPIQLAPGVQTLGELEVIEHLEAGLPVIDTRNPTAHAQATIPGARNFPHDRVDEWRDTLDRGTAAILFCNGPQCPATPHVIRTLLEAGHPADALRYYRGGMHDWITLGLPVTTAQESGD